jgi:hypothetical protein
LGRGEGHGPQRLERSRVFQKLDHLESRTFREIDVYDDQVRFRLQACEIFDGCPAIRNPYEFAADSVLLERRAN